MQAKQGTAMHIFFNEIFVYRWGLLIKTEDKNSFCIILCFDAETYLVWLKNFRPSSFLKCILLVKHFYTFVFAQTPASIKLHSTAALHCSTTLLDDHNARQCIVSYFVLTLLNNDLANQVTASRSTFFHVSVKLVPALGQTIWFLFGLALFNKQ